MFTFQWPWMGVLLLLPLLVRLLLPARKISPVLPVLRFPYLERLQQAFTAWQPQQQNKGRLFLLLLSLLWLCLVLALMRPQTVDRMTQVDQKGYDIMLAVDLSGSMRALDFSTQQQRLNRLDVAKNVVGDFVRDRKSDRIGLVLFGDSAYQYVPLTLDTDSVSRMLNETVISMAGDGTAIGDAIGLSVKALRNRPQKSRIVILLTDGEDTASSIPPLQAAGLAADYGIRIYTIAIGRKGQVPYPTQGGHIVMVEASLDENLLKNIAEKTGGNYYRATDRQALRKVYERIDELEKTQIETRDYMIRTPLYRYPLSAGLAFLLVIGLWPLLPGRRGHAA